jgi:3-hydroxyisobutyrate dehydrogenase-like beta-hydroxyacid dehydrogenase
MKVTILGIGKMGGAMARRLHQQGFDVRLWNRTRQRAEQLGVGEVFDTPAEASRDAEVVISMLTDPPAVRQAYLGPDGALEAEGPRTYVDSSTVDPKTHQALARVVEQRGSSFLEAPVLGSVPAVDAGKLLILIGGERAAFERLRVVLEALGDGATSVRSVPHLGSSWSPTACSASSAPPPASSTMPGCVPDWIASGFGRCSPAWRRTWTRAGPATWRDATSQ